MPAKIAVRAARQEDVDYIFTRLSKITEDEIMAVGLGHQGLYDYVLTQMDAFPAAVAVYEGEPCAILGLERGQNDDMFTWFVASETYFALGLKSAMFGRKFMKSLKKTYPEKRILSASSSPHPDTARWFSLMGGKLIGDHGGTKVFEF